MDPSLQASFIPKKPLTEARGGRGFSGLVLLVAVLIFVASIAAAGGAFAYKNILEQSLNSKKDSLVKYQEAFDLPSIQSLVRFDSRINEARVVLTNHVAPSAIFFFLSQQTLEKVQLLKFEYAIGDSGGTTVVLNGIADSFSTVALQSDQLGASKVLKDIIFSDIAVETGGKVSFQVAASVDKSLLLYSKNIGSPQIQVPASVETSPTTPTSSVQTTP